jgi:hypothetical protein
MHTKPLLHCFLNKYFVLTLCLALIACGGDSSEGIATVQSDIDATKEQIDEILVRLEKLEVTLADLRSSAHRSGTDESDGARGADPELGDALLDGSGAKPKALLERVGKLEEQLESGLGGLSVQTKALSKRSQHNQEVLFRHIQALEEKVGIPRGQSINSGSLIGGSSE